MSDSICSVEDCNVKVSARGMCNPHYQRLLRTGTTDRRQLQSEMPCTIEGCERQRHGHGLCATHRSQMRRNGEITAVRVWASLEERFWSAVTKTETCWLFSKLAYTGYGYFSAYGRHYSAHRFAYEFLVGPIPDGLTIDHLCRNRACVNPQHLEPVTHWENNMRSANVSALNAQKTECLRGHPFSDENTYYTKRGQRHCRECMKIRERKYANRRKGVA